MLSGARINDMGQIVGIGGSNGAFLLDPNGSFIPINFPGATNGTMPFGINDMAEIVGLYRVFGSGTDHSFLATPEAVPAVPEPATLTLLTTGLILGGLSSRRRWQATHLRPLCQSLGIGTDDYPAIGCVGFRSAAISAARRAAQPT
jgi:hypothetical protein